MRRGPPDGRLLLRAVDSGALQFAAGRCGCPWDACAQYMHVCFGFWAAMRVSFAEQASCAGDVYGEGDGASERSSFRGAAGSHDGW